MGSCQADTVEGLWKKIHEMLAAVGKCIAQGLSHLPKTEFGSIYEQIYGGLRDGEPDEVFGELNRQMRALGFAGSKGAYELRKICIDHVYQRFGAEMAVSISGDDIRTTIRYYADPAQPNVGDVRIADLL